VIGFSGTGITITGAITDIDKIVGSLGITLSDDFNVVMTGALGSTSGNLDLVSYIAGNSTGGIQLVGTSGGNTLNFSSISKGMTIDGDAGNDNITGTSFNDLIIGGAGTDSITLGTGNDTVRFNSLTGIDTVADYTPSDDLIQLAKSVFVGLTTASGALSSGEFESGAGLTAAATSAGRVVYNSTSGALYYDADGTGGNAAVQIATLTGAPVLNHNEFFIV
jgi:Ca2+-binding RTX toxin-like protein